MANQTQFNLHVEENGEATSPLRTLAIVHKIIVRERERERDRLNTVRFEPFLRVRSRGRVAASMFLSF